ncbi:MAG: hypothetical protein ACI9R3_000652 [Verrucomicrobiales bacterium]|jgi:hypothetical protein
MKISNRFATALTLLTATLLTSSLNAESIRWASHRIMDRSMVAGTIEAPADWRFQGGVQWLDPNRVNPPDALKVSYTGTSPNGAFQFQVNPTYSWLSGRNSPALHQFSNYTKTPIGPSHNAISVVLQEYLPSARRNARVISQEPLESASRAQTQILQQQMAPNLRSGQMSGAGVDVALVTIEYVENGQRYREAILSTLNYFILGSEHSEQARNQRSMGMEALIAQKSVAEIISMRAPAQVFDSAKPMFARMTASRKNTPEWNKVVHDYYVKVGIRHAQESSAQLKASAQQHQAKMKSLWAQFDASQARYRSDSNSRDSSNRDFLNMITETDDFYDPHSDQERNLDDTHENMWIDSSGNVLPSDDPSFDPRVHPDYWNRDFRPADRVR